MAMARACRTLHRWVQRFAPELEQRTRRHLRPCRGPWHVDATSVRVGGGWRYLYRAVDGTGQTIDFRLSAKRDKRAAKLWRFTRHRRGRWLNNLVEPDHRRVKRGTEPMLGFESFRTARRMLAGIEAVAMRAKGQVRAAPRDDRPAQRAFVHQVFGLAA